MTTGAPGSFDRVAKIYDATRGLPAEAEEQVARTLADLFRPAGTPPRVLEVGVGTGRIAMPLAAQGCRITGVDLALGMLAELRGKGSTVGLVIGSALELPIRREAFDGALFVHVLHLLTDARRAVREALRVVRPGGVVVFGGEDFWLSDLTRETRRLMREVIREVTGLDLGGSSRHVEVLQTIQSQVAAAGHALERVPLGEWESQVTGRELLRQLERKDMSWMWPIPDDALPTVCGALRPRLEALCGDLDRVHPVPRSMSALVAQLA